LAVHKAVISDTTGSLGQRTMDRHEPTTYTFPQRYTMSVH